MAPLLRAGLGLAFLAVAAGCPGTNYCGRRQEPVTGIDGGLFDCVRPEDCPRPSNVFVCVSDGVDDKDCVRCEEARCVRTIPVACP